MPYHIRKLPGRELYKVYGESGNPHSKKGLDLKTAKKQMTALNIAHARKEGAAIPIRHSSIEYVKMPVDDYLSEHKRLIGLLEKVGAEGKKQKKEIMEFLKK